MTDSSLPAAPNLGFLTVFADAAGYVGGYLVTNSWGRPLEFRLSTAVHPNKVQQILYGPSLAEYVTCDLIGKTLIDKTSTSVHLILADSFAVLPLRSRLDVPVVVAAPQDDPLQPFLPDRPVRHRSSPTGRACPCRSTKRSPPTRSASGRFSTGWTPGSTRPSRSAGSARRWARPAKWG